MADSDLACDTQNVLVLGAGAMGCYFAARLVESGAKVTLIDIDQARIDHLNADGLSVTDDSGTRIVRVKASRAELVHGAASLIVVFTKGMHTRSAMQSVAHLVAPYTAALTLQNGLGNPEMIAEVVASQRVMFGVTDVPADLDPPAKVHSMGKGKSAFWTLDGVDMSLLAETEALLAAAGLTATVTIDAQVAVWEKVAFNAALNALAAILEFTVGQLDTPDARAIATSIVDETLAVAMRLGIDVDLNRIMGRIDYALTTHGGHKPSMLQDMLAGRRTEIDLINGAIAAAGAKLGVPTPVNATLMHLVKAKENREKTPTTTITNEGSRS